MVNQFVKFIDPFIRIAQAEDVQLVGLGQLARQVEQGRNSPVLGAGAKAGDYKCNPHYHRSVQQPFTGLVKNSLPYTEQKFHHFLQQ